MPDVLAIFDYKVGDEIWWFKYDSHELYTTNLMPGKIELVHDVIKEIKDGHLYCWHSSKKPHEVWGKSRKEAWAKLKSHIEKWGSLE